MLKFSAISFGLSSVFTWGLAFGLMVIDIDADEMFKALWVFYSLTAICLWLETKEKEAENAE